MYHWCTAKDVRTLYGSACRSEPVPGDRPVAPAAKDTHLLASPDLAVHQILHTSSLLQRFLRCWAFTSAYLACNARSISLFEQTREGGRGELGSCTS